MQNAKRKMQNEKKGSRPDRSKRTMKILAVLALVLLLLVGGGLWTLLSMLNPGKTPAATGEGDLESYLSEKWTVFQLRAWEPETGTLELDYPLRFSYAQMEKYGASLDELRELPRGNLATVSALKQAAFEDLGLTIRAVTVYGFTNDGEIAYTLRPDGSVSACWEEP